jgi:hypothetical protein
MYFLVIVSSSFPSNPVSAKIVKIVANFGVDALIILFMLSSFGISGIVSAIL